MAGKLFNAAELAAIADALPDTSEGLTGSEIEFILSECGMTDVSPDLTKRKRLFNAFVGSQNSRQDKTRILGFIRKAMKPPRYVRQPERYEPLRANLNRALAFVGMLVESDGTLKTRDAARTLPEAERRARELRDDLAGVVVASADGQNFQPLLEELIDEGLPVTVLGFHEHASWAVGHPEIEFVDLEDIDGVFREPLPRVNLDNLPEGGAWLQPFRPLAALLNNS